MGAVLPARVRPAPSPFRPVSEVARLKRTGDMLDARPGHYMRVAAELGAQILGMMSEEFGEARAVELAEIVTTFHAPTPAHEARQDRAWAALVDSADAVDRACR